RRPAAEALRAADAGGPPGAAGRVPARAGGALGGPRLRRRPGPRAAAVRDAGGDPVPAHPHLRTRRPPHRGPAGPGGSEGGRVARWEDRARVAARARERLLLAMPGETHYLLTDPSGRDVPLTEAQQAREAAKEGEWFSVLWESVEASSRLTPEDIPDEAGSTD